MVGAPGKRPGSGRLRSRRPGFVDFAGSGRVSVERRRRRYVYRLGAYGRGHSCGVPVGWRQSEPCGRNLRRANSVSVPCRLSVGRVLPSHSELWDPLARMRDPRPCLRSGVRGRAVRPRQEQDADSALRRLS